VHGCFVDYQNERDLVLNAAKILSHRVQFELFMFILCFPMVYREISVN
jgi:hypothetical protein